MSGQADIGTPAVIAAFRGHLVVFLEEARRAAEQARSDVEHVAEWLQHEQAAHWRDRIRRLENAREAARAEERRARHGASQASAVDEKKRLRRVERDLEEARDKLAGLGRWRRRLERETGTHLKRCTFLANLVEGTGPKAIGRLDHLRDHLDEYLAARPARSSEAGEAPCPD